MHKNNLTLLLFIVPLLLSTGILNKANRMEKKIRSSDFASYEVRLTFTGYISLYSSNPLADCDIRRNGKVILTGLLSGEENVDPNDDINYTGILHDSINIDICSVKRLPNGEDKFCYMTVTGSGPVNTELKIQSDGQGNSRGAYIKINYDKKLGMFTRKVIGNCNSAEMVEEENMVPNETAASIFNGYDLPGLIDRTLIEGKKYTMTGEAGETVVEVIRKIK